MLRSLPDGYCSPAQWLLAKMVEGRDITTRLRVLNPQPHHPQKLNRLLRLTQCKHAAATGNAKMHFIIKLSHTKLLGPQKKTKPTSLFYSEVVPQAPSQKICRGRQGWGGVGVGESATLCLISSRTLHEILSR